MPTRIITHPSRGAKRTIIRLTLMSALLALTIGAISSQSRLVAAQTSPWAALDLGSQAGPPSRYDHTLAADPVGDQLVLFGGRDANGASFGDTWVYDIPGDSWTVIDSPAPPPRFGHGVAVDTASRALYLFAGEDGPIFYNDTWRFDLDTLEWTEIALASPSRPAERYGISAVLDDDGRLIISHGFTFDGRFDDTWRYDPMTDVWTDISPGVEEARPLPRCLHQGEWDTEAGVMYLFGGCASGFGPCPLNDLWAFDPVTSVWTFISEAGPAPRMDAAFILDADRDHLLVFGGRTSGAPAGDLWSFSLSGGEWRELPAVGAPSARSSHDGARIDDQLFIFGGLTDAGPVNDLWALDLAR